MGECGYCERSVYAGHAPTCKFRCKATTPDVPDTASRPLQCERGIEHDGIHAVYGEDGEEVIRCWPNTVALAQRYFMGRSPNYGFVSIVDRQTNTYAPFATSPEALAAMMKLLAGIPTWWVKWHSLGGL